MEKYSECFSLYKKLVKNTQDDFEEERETNLSAVLAALQTWGDQGDVVSGREKGTSKPEGCRVGRDTDMGSGLRDVAKLCC